MVGVLDGPGVVGVALHQHDVDASRGEDGHGALHIIEVGGTRGDEHRLAQARDDVELLEPVHVTGAHLERVHPRVQMRDGLEVVRG